MRSRPQRFRGLLQRYRTDGRLPPPVSALYRDVVRLRSRDARFRVRRALRLTGRGRSSGGTAALKTHSVPTAGPPSMSLFELGRDVATKVSGALTEANVDHYVVRRAGDGLEFGVALDDRLDALEAIGRLGGDGWLLESFNGNRRRMMPLADAAANRHVRRARTWTVFRAHTWSERAIGLEQGAVLSFWELGTSGELEKIGIRSQERFDPRSPATIEIVDGHRYPGRTAFPVGANLEHVVDPIDIVYTWVDGSDPEWQAAFRATAAAAGRSVDETALDPARYHNRDELRYSLRSVWTYCGWVRRIWIVTAGQRPDWLMDDPRIRLVDHTEILPADALPTFNSHAIEAALHHIDGLAEHFIYFNDDMFVSRSLRPEDFFEPNGLARVFQSGARPPGVEDERTRADETAARRGRELLAAAFGRVARGMLYHSPYPLRRSVMFEIEDRFADVVAATQRSRFRSPADLSTASSFVGHYALATGRAVLGDIATEYANVESARLRWHLDRIRLDERLQTYCINETHRRGESPQVEEEIADFFEWMLPIAAPWER